MAPEEQAKGAPRNVVAMFEDTVARLGQAPCARHKRDGRWVDISWGEMGRRARAVSDGLASLGVKPGDRLSILGETTPEWILADLGIMGAGAVTVPIYQSNRPHEVQYILDDSGARWIFCDSEAQIQKVREVRARLPELRGVLRFSGPPADAFERALADVERAGAEWQRAHGNAHAARIAAVDPADPACFIYTSGTTGNPKGVVLTHANWVYEATASAQIHVMEPDDLLLLFLPMAHSFAKVIEAVWFHVGGTIAFVESMEKIVDNAGEVRPTTMPAVPRVFEKAYNAVVANGLSAPGLKGKLFQMALRGLDEWVEAREQGRSGGGIGYLVGRRLVFPKVAARLKERFGGRMRLFVSGGAPLSPRINWFFHHCGLEILEGYGLTESSAASFVNRLGQNRIGTVGPPVPGTEVRIAEDGEILIRGPGVMKEYYRNPSATSEVIVDGWLQTGDIGLLDEAGHLRITDRKKDIIVTAGGKNVAPQNLENELKAEPFISQVVVHGDRRRFLSALVTLNEENVRKWAQENGVRLANPVTGDPRVRERIQRAIDAVNGKQASYATIKKFAILERDFTQEGGELTPTLKVKRKVVSERYRALLDSFYVEG
jgi:long-chain acyl-CoA synthetase